MSPPTTYQIKITNHTHLPQTYTLKAPNIPSPVPLSATLVFPPLHEFTLSPSKTFIFKSEILSSSQQAHQFLILATPCTGSQEGLLPIENDILVDFWRDEGGLKGDYCAVVMRAGGEGRVAWEIGFSWQAYTLAPKIEVRGTGLGGRMAYEDK